MIAFEVRLNGKRVCVAGVDDLGVLTATIAAVGKLGNKAVPAGTNPDWSAVHYSVGGLTSRPGPNKDVHLGWKSVVPLKVGEALQVRILDTQKVDCLPSRVSAKKNRGKAGGRRKLHPRTRPGR